VPIDQLSVLIAEDTAKLREELVAQLTALGIEPSVAKSGFEALKLVQQGRPDLILLDGLLPEMHGFEIARAVRKLDKDYHPRIVLITAIYKGVHYQNEARLKYGIDDYLIKPVSKQALADLVEKTRANGSR
jgi:CheY-like chemotaxis protein